MTLQAPPSRRLLQRCGADGHRLRMPDDPACGLKIDWPHFFLPARPQQWLAIRQLHLLALAAPPRQRHFPFQPPHPLQVGRQSAPPRREDWPDVRREWCRAWRPPGQDRRSYAPRAADQSSDHRPHHAPGAVRDGCSPNVREGRSPRTRCGCARPGVCPLRTRVADAAAPPTRGHEFASMRDCDGRPAP
jgi:hypothetical protein